MRTLQELRAAIALQSTAARRMVFGVCNESGWLRGSAAMVQLTCGLWNHRHEIDRALRLMIALRAHKDHALRLEAGSCTCLTKSPDTEHHAPDCVYASVAEAVWPGQNRNPHAT